MVSRSASGSHDALFIVFGGRMASPVSTVSTPTRRCPLVDGGLTDRTVPVEGAPLVAGSAVAIAVRQRAALRSLRSGARTARHPRERVSGTAAPRGLQWTTHSSQRSRWARRHRRPTGDLRWRQVLGPRPLEADVPRRLEPVLRCGALFVPCSLIGLGDGALRKASDPLGGAAAGISVIRPSDGAVLGTIAPTETIPDLLRVDEHCDVYVAEESGHLVAFGALPRLSLVK